MSCIRSGEITPEALVAQSVTQLSRFCTFLHVRLIIRKPDTEDINTDHVGYIPKPAPFLPPGRT
jgi:hypothetical protein